VGEGGAAPLPALELGEEVSVRGRIDRIDLTPQGEAVVYDYKARSTTPAAKWVGEGALQVALYMRATEQLLGRPVAGGFYQPLSGKDLRARGVLDADSGLGLDCVRTDRRERTEVRELLEQCLQAALSAAAQARDGALESRPQTCSYKGGCMYPTICRSGS
jgi:RecB family exonuclease